MVRLSIGTWILIICFINPIIGAVVATSLDTKDLIFYKWYKECPIPGLGHYLILFCWPALAIGMIKYRVERKRILQKLV